MPELSTIYGYMRAHAALLGECILHEFPALDDPVLPRVDELLRPPFPAQAIAIMVLAKRWQQARTGMVVAECGTGKTLISLGAIHVHSDGNAKIIDVRREPMACCFSNLKQLFASGQEFSYSIEDIARYYRTYLELPDQNAIPGIGWRDTAAMNIRDQVPICIRVRSLWLICHVRG